MRVSHIRFAAIMAGSPSFEETDWDAQAVADDQEIKRILANAEQEPGQGLAINDDPFDQTNKADDAEDFEDISDDDLPDEEEAPVGASFELPALTDDGGTSNDADDLFGEGPSSPIDPVLGATSPGAQVHDADAGEDTQATDHNLNFQNLNFDPEPTFGAGDNQDLTIPEAVESVEDLLKAAWPAYKKGHILTWSELLPPKAAVWKGKKPSKKPKRLVTSKLTLELAPDDSVAFRVPGGQAAVPKTREEDNIPYLVKCNEELDGEAVDIVQFDLDQESDSEPIMGFTLRDIEMACEDWGAQIGEVEQKFTEYQTAEEVAAAQVSKRVSGEQEDDEWDAEFLMDTDAPAQPVPKNRNIVTGLPAIPRHSAPSFDNFQDATRRGAKRVHLEMSDPHLLIETTESQRNAKRQRLDKSDTKKRMANGKMGRDITSRFNLSNDEAYDMLKENHQNKVRATLGNIAVEHGMPAHKLTWPYYKVKLPGTADEYHRPRLRYKKFAGHTIKFDRPLVHKRKNMRGKAHDVFQSTKDLSFNDNSTAVLFEYCEPRPRVLNNFAMGSKIINYHRRKDTKDDESLPKQELGEYRFLLPEDRSPFSTFGTVDAGETVPTLHNEMYRAPVFKHTPRSTDFLIVRSSTGAEGSKWYMHKIDHLHVVGQQFPSVEVPGPHSRRVTNASKNRMKMLAFRMIRHSKVGYFHLSAMTKHIADSTDAQNRQKLKEFLQYYKLEDKSHPKGHWTLRKGDVLPDESTTRAMVKPEDVSLLDSMQLGIKELVDAGYDPRNANLEEDGQGADADGEEDDDEEGSKAPKAGGAKKAAEKQEETLADKMAPWKTTKAFLDACAQKAMLALHGPGDPTGHGLGFSFIRTSMKGGYIEAVQGPMATSADAMEREKRANGGHAYNVKKQQALYEEGIRKIWGEQKRTLSDGQEHDDTDIQQTTDEDDRFNANAAATPAQFDEGVSQLSGYDPNQTKKALRITRVIELPDGTEETRTEIVYDPVVASQYTRRRDERDMELQDIYSSKPTGNADADRTSKLRIRQELDRLEKNQARRKAREQQKELLHNKNANGPAGSPGATGGGASVDKVPTGTTRKCANCGQVGHIKTNKKLCPLLNGTMSTDNGAAEHGGFGTYAAPTGPSGSP